MGISLATNLKLDGCDVAFLKVTPRTNGSLNFSSTFDAICALRNRGVDRVRTVISAEKAIEEKMKIQDSKGRIPPNQRFLQLTQKGVIISMHI